MARRSVWSFPDKPLICSIEWWWIEMLFLLFSFSYIYINTYRYIFSFLFTLNLIFILYTETPSLLNIFFSSHLFTNSQFFFFHFCLKSHHLLQSNSILAISCKFFFNENSSEFINFCFLMKVLFCFFFPFYSFMNL